MVQPSASKATPEQLQEFYEELLPQSLGALWTVQEQALTSETAEQGSTLSVAVA